MSHFFYQGKSYPWLFVNEMPLKVLLDLEEYAGTSIEFFAEMFKSTETIDFFDGEAGTQYYLAVMWGNLRCAGVDISYEDANDLPLDAIDIISTELRPATSPSSTPTPEGWRSGRRSKRASLKATEAFPVINIRESVYKNIAEVSFVWQGITPLNVWDLPYDMWCVYERNVDAYLKAKLNASAGAA